MQIGEGKLADSPQRRGDELFIVDNSDSDWKVRDYLREWSDISSAFDIATGYFEIGALLCLKEKWQGVERIRILMGDEVSHRTRHAFGDGLRNIIAKLDASVEVEKKKNDFLEGVPAIVEAMRSGKIVCRIYRRDKFHAKAYITHGQAAVVGSFALVGSSNFTYPGLNENVELNVQVRGPEVRLLQEWYERHWEDAEDVTVDILRVLERHTNNYLPYDVWTKALHEFFAAHELTPDEWDREQSRIFPVLARYQQDAYKNIVRIAQTYGAGFLCDGVGLGKSFVGLMLIERLIVHEGKRVALFAPKAAREDVWEPLIDQYLPELRSGFVNLLVYNHTDLQRGGHWPKEFAASLKDADAVIIDEAHHFRNPGIAGTGHRRASRYRQLQNYLHQEGGRAKRVYFLTATPINNSVHDFRHIVELVSGSDDAYFSKDSQNLGIHSLRRHFVDLEKGLLKGHRTEDVETLEVPEIEVGLKSEPLFEKIVVQRSRSYVIDSQRALESGQVLFPERQPPEVLEYQLKATYGRLLDAVEKAFDRQEPLFVLGIYYPLAYWKGPTDDPEYEPFNRNRQKQVVALIRTQFLKRFESSAKAFQMSCWRLLRKLLAWVEVHAQEDREKARLKRWKISHADLIDYVEAHQSILFPDEAAEDQNDEFLSEEDLEAVEVLSDEKYDVSSILKDTYDDLDQLARFLELVEKIDPAKDDKLKALLRLLKTDKRLKYGKVIVFSEFADTVAYLEQQLRKSEVPSVERIDGSCSQRQRSDAIRRFSPYYNGSSIPELAKQGKQEIRVLVATDVLAEGLNLQDASLLINYDVHWNPVRLMQRIGRVDRRMNLEIEAAIVSDRPWLAESRKKIYYWNFLPPEELDNLLRLYQRVSHKTLMISKTLGVDTGKLYKGEDSYDVTKNLNKLFDGEQSDTERLRLEYQKLLHDDPELASRLDKLPLKVFSGRENPHLDAKAVFFCFRIPRPDPDLTEAEEGRPRWSESAGDAVWVLVKPDGSVASRDPALIAESIRSLPDTPRSVKWDRAELTALRRGIEKQLVQDFLRPLNAPVGVSPVLKCWMELH